MAQEIQADIAELQQFLQVAKRPIVRQCLEKQIAELKQKETSLGEPSTIKNATPSVVADPSIPAPMKVEKTNINILYSALSGYSWEQATDSVKILVSLEQVGTLAPGNVQVEFRTTTVDVKVHGLNNQNYRFSKILNEIKPEESSYTIKANRIILNLKKKESGNWEKLEPKKEKIKKPELNDKDPNAGIMELMKNMYEEGDDEMKRTIAKAWTESRDKKGSTGLDPTA